MFKRRMLSKKQGQTLIFSKSGKKKTSRWLPFVLCKIDVSKKMFCVKSEWFEVYFFKLFFFQGTSLDLTSTVTFVGIRWDTCLHHIPLPIWKKSARTIKIVDVSVGKRFSGVQTLTWVSDNPLDFDEYKSSPLLL